MASCVKPHVVCIPAQAQSHTKALLKLAKVLHHKGFHITFVNTESNHKRFLESRGPNSLDGLPDFRFETIPGIPPSVASAKQDASGLREAILKNLVMPFRNLLVKLNDAAASSNVPPVTCIISDVFMVFANPIAKQLGIPIVNFFALAACTAMGFAQYPALKDAGLIPLKDESDLSNGYLDTVVDWIPGMKDIRLRDLPAFLRTTNPNDREFQICMEVAKMSHMADALVIHSFDALENDVLKGLSSIYSKVYAIGPLELMLKNIPQDPLKSIGYNLWKEEPECLKWLDSQQPNSVIYVNFGSITVMSQQQLVEFGMGLANSKYPFLWIIRSDLVIGEAAAMPPEFLTVIQERGFIGNWCPQEEVLNHPSVGGFLTHSGWASIIESISAGVPMVNWPFFGDQPTNCRYTCVEWEIGMEIDNEVKRDGVSKLVSELMEGEKGKDMKNKVMELKKLAQEAVGSDGSSSINLDNLVNDIVLYKS